MKFKVLMIIAVMFLLPLVVWSMGELSVDSFPDQASVFIDNKYYGKTPLLIRNLSDGVHEVMVIKEGERAFIEKVRVYPNDRTKVMADFTSVSKYGRKSIDQDNLSENYQEDRNLRNEKEWRRERSKVRLRNTILGLGLLNEVITDHKRTRRNVRKVLGGLEVLNELGVFGDLLAPR